MTDSASIAPREFIVLDTWVLADFTRGSLANHLSNLVLELDLTILVDILALVELYDPRRIRFLILGRTRAASEFLVDHPSCLVNPQELLLAEVRAYPTPLHQIPLVTDLQSLHWSTREYLLMGLFRRNQELLSLGLDLGAWAKDYEASKSSWPETVQAIIDHAAGAGILCKRRDGSIDLDKSDKQGFLSYLDRRFLRRGFHQRANRHELRSITENMRELSYGGTSTLPAVRLTSLAFWHAYVDTEKAYPARRRGSDLGDLYRIALLPYCRYFTADSAMERILNRVLADSPQRATVLGPDGFRQFLDKYEPEPGSLLRY